VLADKPPVVDRKNFGTYPLVLLLETPTCREPCQKRHDGALISRSNSLTNSANSSGLGMVYVCGRVGRLG
jgi:hypothetical protein